MLTKPAALEYTTTGEQDAYGHGVAVVEYVAIKCYYRMLNTTIGDVVGQEAIEMKVVVPPDTCLDNLTGMKIDEIRFQIAGRPFEQWNPRTRAHEYTTLPVRRAL